MNFENNKMQFDIENLFKQNVNDLSAIKELYRKLKEVEEKITQIKYIDSTLANKLKKDYEKLKRIILDENAAATLSDEIERVKTKLTNDIKTSNLQLTNDIETINSQQIKLTGDIESINLQMEQNKKDYTNKINGLVDNKRIFKPVFGHCVDWSFRDGNGGNWTEERIKTEIDTLKEFDIEEISVTIQTKCRNGNVTLISDLDLFKKCLDYAKEKGIKTSMIKIHCNEFRSALNIVSDTTNLINQWCSLVESVSSFFKGYCDYFVPLNEGEHIFKEDKYETFLFNCLNICKEKGYKTGFTPSSATQWDNLPEIVRYTCDFISFNCYPTISLKGLKTTYEDVVNAFEEYQLNQWIDSHKEKYNKEIIITEIGIEDRASCFASTFVWDFGNGEDFNDGKVQKIMLKGIFESLKDNDNLDKLFYWYPFRGNAVKEVINYYVGGNYNE